MTCRARAAGRLHAGELLARTGPFRCTRRSAGQQRAAHRSRDKESQAEIIAAVKARYAATGGTERVLATMLIDHGVPRWLITVLLMQFFGTRDLGALTPVDKLWLYEVVKSLHNGFKNALMVDTSRSQWHVWLSLLLAMGTGRHHLGSIWTTVRGRSKPTRTRRSISCRAFGRCIGPSMRRRCWRLSTT